MRLNVNWPFLHLGGLVGADGAVGTEMVVRGGAMIAVVVVVAVVVALVDVYLVVVVVLVLVLVLVFQLLPPAMLTTVSS